MLNPAQYSISSFNNIDEGFDIIMKEGVLIINNAYSNDECRDFACKLPKSTELYRSAVKTVKQGRISDIYSGIPDIAKDPNLKL